MLGLEPNFISAVMLIVCNAFGFFSFFPQIVKTIRTKKSDDIAISSWIVWIIGYSLMAAYSFIFSSDIVFFITEISEGVVCLFTLIVCLKYRTKKK